MATPTRAHTYARVYADEHSTETIRTTLLTIIEARRNFRFRRIGVPGENFSVNEKWRNGRPVDRSRTRARARAIPCLGAPWIIGGEQHRFSFTERGEFRESRRIENPRGAYIGRWKNVREKMHVASSDGETGSHWRKLPPLSSLRASHRLRRHRKRDA